MQQEAPIPCDLYSTPRAAKILKMLMEVNTSNPPGNERALMQVICSFLTEEGASPNQLHLLHHTSARSSLVLEISGGSPETIIGFAGHLDTVPAGNPDSWQSDPFVPVEQDGWVTGRGAADMKGGLTSMLLVACHYLRHKPPVSLRFIFTADEEASGIGIQAVRQAGWIKDLSFLFICEPTSCQPALSEKGVAWYDFTIRGKTSHAAMPQEGVNALEKGFAFLLELKSVLEAAAQATPLLGQNTFTISTAQAGVKINVLPDEAVFSADFRFVPAPANSREATEVIIARLAAAHQAASPGLCINWQLRDRREAIASNQDDPTVQQLLHCCSKQPVGVLFFTDASLVIPYYPRLPFVILGPGAPAECHRPDESIPLSEIGQAAEIYTHMIESF